MHINVILDSNRYACAGTIRILLVISLDIVLISFFCLTCCNGIGFDFLYIYVSVLYWCNDSFVVANRLLISNTLFTRLCMAS